MTKLKKTDNLEPHGVSASYSSDLLADAAIDLLRDRKGFRHWWDNIDGEMQQDVHACLHERFLQITGG